MSKQLPRKLVQEKKSAARKSRILRLVKAGYNYAEIGDMLVPKVSRQRVWQIVKAAQG
jgi:hypothetical protein